MLSDAELRVLRAVAEALIPPGGPFPLGAGDVGTAETASPGAPAPRAQDAAVHERLERSHAELREELRGAREAAATEAREREAERERTRATEARAAEIAQRLAEAERRLAAPSPPTGREVRRSARPATCWSAATCSMTSVAATRSKLPSAKGRDSRLPCCTRSRPRAWQNPTASADGSMPEAVPNLPNFLRLPPVPQPASRMSGSGGRVEWERSASTTAQRPRYHQWRSSTS